MELHFPYYRAETSRAEVGLRKPSMETAEALCGLLQSQELQTEIERGNITLAMIRPGLMAATNIEGADVSIAETLEEQIGDLGVAVKFAVQLDGVAINEFYVGPKQGMLQKAPRRPSGLNNQWEEFESVMLSGPVTVLILHSPAGDAIDTWRQQVGHWNIEDKRDPTTIRGKFGLDNYNNLVHGSDGPEAVAREVVIISQCLMRKAQEHDEQSN